MSLSPLSPAWPELLKLPASSCCYEPRGFSAALWGRSHALPKRKKGRKTAITISERQKKWEQHAWLCPHVSSQHLHACFCPFNTEHLEKIASYICMSGWLLSFLFSGQKFSSFLSRWWSGRVGEKIGNRATHSGSESAQHLVVCWLWKWQGLGGWGWVLVGTNEIVRRQEQKQKVSVSAYFLLRVCVSE